MFVERRDFAAIFLFVFSVALPILSCQSVGKAYR